MKKSVILGIVALLFAAAGYTIEAFGLPGELRWVGLGGFLVCSFFANSARDDEKHAALWNSEEQGSNGG